MREQVDKKIDMIMQTLQEGRIDMAMVRVALVSAYNSGYSAAKKEQFVSGVEKGMPTDIDYDLV